MRYSEVKSAPEEKLASKIGKNVWVYDSQGSGADSRRSGVKEVLIIEADSGKVTHSELSGGPHRHPSSWSRAGEKRRATEKGKKVRAQLQQGQRAK